MSMVIKFRNGYVSDMRGEELLRYAGVENDDFEIMQKVIGNPEGHAVALTALILPHGVYGGSSMGLFKAMEEAEARLKKPSYDQFDESMIPDLTRTCQIIFDALRYDMFNPEFHLSTIVGPDMARAFYGAVMDLNQGVYSQIPSARRVSAVLRKIKFRKYRNA